MKKGLWRVFATLGLGLSAAAVACVSDDSTPISSFALPDASLDVSAPEAGALDASTSDAPAADSSAPDASAVDAAADTSLDASDAGPLLLTTGLTFTDELVVSGGNLYWLEGAQYSPKSIKTCPVTGCATPRTIVTEPGVMYLRYLAVDDTNVYYTTQDSVGGGRVMRASLSGVDAGADAGDAGGGTLLSDENTTGPTPQQPWNIAVRSSGLYWIQYFSGDLVHCDPSSCAATRKVIGNGGPRARTVAFTPSSIVWVGEGNPASQSFVASCSLPECDAGVTTLMYPGQNARQLRIAEPSFYFLNLDTLTTKYQVRTCPLTGCPDGGSALVVSSDETELAAQQLAANSEKVYWLNANRVVSCPAGGCDGGAASVHASVPGGETATLLTGDESYLYAVTAEGSVWRLPK